MRSTCRSAHPRAFTLVEIMIVVIIISICTVMAMDGISAFEANQRADRGAREALVWFRFARNLAMTTGKKAKVSIDTTNKTLAVYWQSNGTTYDVNPYATSMTATGTAVLNFGANRELTGSSISVNPVATTYFEFGALGTCSQSGTLTFTYAGRSKSLAIAAVGDPQIQ
jgi:prepilin-type N-terminal cleavage/methylation domain-containing protein